MNEVGLKVKREKGTLCRRWSSCRIREADWSVYPETKKKFCFDFERKEEFRNQITDNNKWMIIVANFPPVENNIEKRKKFDRKMEGIFSEYQSFHC